MATKDYYKTLELTEEDKKLHGEDFTKKVKEKYRNLAKRYHPDRYANKTETERKEAEEKFKEITEAYDVLTDSKKKQQYDAYGSYDGSFNWEGFGSTGMDDIDEMLNRFRSGAFGHFGGGFGFDMGGMGRNSGTQKPQPLKLKWRLSIEDIYNGGSKKIRYKRMVPCAHCDGKGLGDGGKIETCPICGGTGHIAHSVQRGPWSVMHEIRQCTNCNGTGQVVTNPCKHCNGTGRTVVTDELDVQIPVGAADGLTFVIPGNGNCAERNKNIVGDMMILITVEPNEKFAIANQYDLYTQIEISILDSITGTKADIELPNGKITTVQIPRFSEDGKILKINGLGMPLSNGGRGALLVEVAHKFPKDISNSEEKLLNELKNSKNFK